MASPAQPWDDLQAVISRLSANEKLRLTEEVAWSLMETSAEASRVDRRAAPERLRQEMAGLPVGSPSDGLSNRDHDRVLYGGGDGTR